MDPPRIYKSISFYYFDNLSWGSLPFMKRSLFPRQIRNWGKFSPAVTDMPPLFVFGGD